MPERSKCDKGVTGNERYDHYFVDVNVNVGSR